MLPLAACLAVAAAPTLFQFHTTTANHCSTATTAPFVKRGDRFVTTNTTTSTISPAHQFPSEASTSKTPLRAPPHDG